MSSARGNNKEEAIRYEQRRLATIAGNKRKLDALKLPSLSNVVQHDQTKKRKKRTPSKKDAATRHHNLRKRPPRNHVDNADEDNGEDQDSKSIGDFLCDNDAADFQNESQKKSKGRGITRLNDIFARAPGMPKIKITLNEYGQPIGDNSRRFASAIGCHTRRKLSIGCADWRLVDAEKKFEVWTDLKEVYDIDDAAFNWFLGTAGMKWKEFKSTVKKQFFDEKISDEELRAKHRDRVNDDDWKFLSNYWRSPESEARTEVAKSNRSKLGTPHTAGSKSFARSGHELAGVLGRPPRRDELYIKTHTRKNGVPLTKAEPIIHKLKSIVEARPELKQKTIQQGDAYAAACGEKEPRGRVRVLGLGPTPQDVGTPGLKSYKPTRLQMEVLARKKAERENAALQQRIAEMEEDMEIMSQHGSNSRHHVSPRSEEHVDEACHNAQNQEDGASDHSGEDDYLIVRRRVVAPATAHHDQMSPGGAAPTVQPRRRIPVAPSSHDELVGKDVILYALLRSDVAVAKGTIISTDPKSTLGDVALGNQYCEVVVNVVLKRDTVLPRPYGYVETMADAHKMPIAWPYKRLKVTKGSQSTQGTTGGRS